MEPNIFPVSSLALKQIVENVPSGLILIVIGFLAAWQLLRLYYSYYEKYLKQREQRLKEEIKLRQERYDYVDTPLDVIKEARVAQDRLLKDKDKTIENLEAQLGKKAEENKALQEAAELATRKAEEADQKLRESMENVPTLADLLRSGIGFTNMSMSPSSSKKHLRPPLLTPISCSHTLPDWTAKETSSS